MRKARSSRRSVTKKLGKVSDSIGKRIPIEIIPDGQFEGEPKTLKEIEEDRGKVYGDPFLSHQAIGLAWEGVFRNRYHDLSSITQNGMGLSIPVFGKLFPADLVAEFLAAFKVVRLARPTFHQDSADDAKVYISFSERFRKR